MKIAWLTPFSKKSAIAYYSLLATEELSKKFDITILAPECDDFFDTKVNVESIDWEFSPSKLYQYDYVVYNIGDHFEYHGIIFDIALKHPGIMILHDLSFMNLLNGYYINHLGSIERYLIDLEKHYGKAAAKEIIEASGSPEKWESLDYQRYNGIDFIKETAIGIIVHSQYHCKRLVQHYSGPNAVIGFPFASKGVKGSGILKSEELLIMTIGNANQNKRITQVIEAIGGDKELVKKVHYCIAGRTDGGAYEEEIKGLIGKYNLQGSVELCGYVDDEKLHNLYQRSDVLINLRNPVIEGASWSLVEAMSQGKPVIVSDHGFYAEMPDDCVIKISSDAKKEVQELRAVLKWAICHHRDSEEIGQKAKTYVAEHFTPLKYSIQFENFLNGIIFLNTTRNLIHAVGREMDALGVKKGMDISIRVSNAINQLFY